MKRIFTYFAALTALFAVSCNRMELNDGNQADRFTISLSAGDLETRAENENQTTAEKKIDHFDYFFFSDSEGTHLLHSGREAGTTKTFDTTTDEYKDIAGKSYLYVIANYPTAIPEGTETLEQLLALPVGVSITEHPEAPFVMDSYDADNDNVLIELVPTKADEVRNQVVMMRRIAAKFVVNVTVAKYAQAAGGLYWKPTTNTKDFYMYMVNALDEATVSGEPLVCSDVEDETKFYTYNHTHNDMTGEDLEWVSAVSYAYPETFAAADQKALYFKVQMPWVHVNDVSLPATGSNIGAMGTHQFYYKVLLPGITEITRNSLYTLNLTLDKVGGTQEDYVVVTGTDLMVTNWLSPSGQYSGYYSARFLDTARDVYYFYGDDEMEIPVTSSHPIAVNVTSATKTTYNVSTGAEVTTNVTDYSKSANGKSSFTITKTLHTDITNKTTFDYTPITYKVTLTHEDGKQPHSKEVTVVQYPPIYVYRNQSNGYAYVNSYAYTRNHGGRYNSGNAYNNNNASLGSMSSLSGSMNNNGSQYVVTVTVLPTGYQVKGLNEEVIIGDPRGGTLTNNYLGYAAGTNGDYVRTVQANYNAVSTTTQNVIAPQIRIASSWGATGQQNNYVTAEERCAAYQENGYPAGRWRVPTVAEIDFLIQLSNYEYIPALFTTERLQNNRYRGYWANGPAIYVGKPYIDDGKNKTFESGSYTTNYSGYVVMNGVQFAPGIRCVYDQWYWGEQKYGNNGQPSNAAATQWIGYIY